MNTFLTLLQPNLTGILCFLASALSFSLGGFVLFKNRNSSINRSFFFITLTGGFWLFCTGMFISVREERLAYQFLLINYFFAVPYISVSVFNFSRHITRSFENKFLLKVGILIGLFISIFSYFNLHDIFTFRNCSWGRFDFFQHTPTGFIFFLSVLIHFSLYALLAFINLVKAYRKAQSPQEKLGLRIFIFGALIGYTGSIDFFVAWNLPMYPIGFLSFTLFLLIVSYGIVRHQFLDIQLIIKKLTAIFLIYGILILLIFPITKFGVPYLTASHMSTASMIFLLGSIIGLLLSTGPFIYALVVKNSYWLRGHTTTGLVHELKSPLATIQGALNIMLDDLQVANLDKDKALDYLTMIQNNATRLDQFIRDLLIVAKGQDDSFQLEKVETSLSTLIDDVVQTYLSSAKQKNLQLTTDLEQNLLPNIDPQKIRHVMSNILSNAIKFSSAGTIHIKCHRLGNTIHCSVQDSGKGLSAKNLSKIFDKFFQVDPGQKGTGIGLSIARTWVEAHGGKIWAESEGEGKGTTIHFTLPL